MEVASALCDVTHWLEHRALGLGGPGRYVLPGQRLRASITIRQFSTLHLSLLISRSLSPLLSLQVPFEAAFLPRVLITQSFHIVLSQRPPSTRSTPLPISVTVAPNIEVKMADFKISAQLVGHEADVRSLHHP